MTPRDKAIELVTGLHNYMDELDVYWNIDDDAKACAKIAIDLISDVSEYWQKVKEEIDKLPYYITDL